MNLLITKFLWNSDTKLKNLPASNTSFEEKAFDRPAI